MSALTDGYWAIVELMGHRQRAGFVQEVEQFGTKQLRIDIHFGEGETATEFYGGSAIYALRPTTEEIARQFARGYGDPRPVAPLNYRLAAPADDGGAADHEPDLFADADADEDEDERPF